MANVKVNLQNMNDWSSKLDTLNNEAANLLATIETDLNELDGYWDGNSADKAIEANKELINKAKDYHTKMKDVSNFLIKVAETMNNQ